MNQILVTISLLIVATCVKAQGVEGIVFDENRTFCQCISYSSRRFGICDYHCGRHEQD